MTQPPQHVDRDLIDNTLFLRRPLWADSDCPCAVVARPRVLPPFLAVIFRRAANIPADRVLPPLVRSLIGAVVMAATLLNLTLATQSTIAGAPKYALQVLIGALILTNLCFARDYSFSLARNTR